MNNFKINQPRASGLLIIDHIVHASIAVRPRSTKLAAPELMGAPEFVSCRLHHLPGERPAIEVVPEALSRKFVGTHSVRSRCISAKTIAVKRVEPFYLPPTPLFDFGPETNRYSSDSKVQIQQFGQLLTVSSAPFNYYSPPTTNLLGDRIDSEGINQSCCDIGQPLRDQFLCRCAGP